jgi:protein-tyrosine-phosphatase
MLSATLSSLKSSPLASISLCKPARWIGTLLFVVTAFAANLATANESSEKPRTIVFVCLHGSVKSQMAAAHFNQIAKERGLPFVAVSRGIAVDSSIPAPIRDGLALEGLAPVDNVPRSLTAEDANAASKIYAFDEVPADKKGGANVTYWSDVPPATKDYGAARDAIVRHIDDLLPSLTAK